MTLQDLFNLVAENPKYVVFYFAILPLAALLAGALDNDRGHVLPWNYIYSFLIYASRSSRATSRRSSTSS